MVSALVAQLANRKMGIKLKTSMKGSTNKKEQKDTLRERKKEIE